MLISAIAAIGENRELGKNNALLWDIPEDMKHFREITRGHAVIMGQKTFESIGKPLPNRVNIILTRDKDFKAEGCIIAYSPEEALELAKKHEQTEVFVIGGGQIYKAMLPYTDRLYITSVHSSFDADTFFPDYSEFNKVISSKDSQDDNYKYTFLVLER